MDNNYASVAVCRISPGSHNIKVKVQLGHRAYLAEVNVDAAIDRCVRLELDLPIGPNFRIGPNEFHRAQSVFHCEVAKVIDEHKFLSQCCGKEARACKCGFHIINKFIIVGFRQPYIHF